MKDTALHLADALAAYAHEGQKDKAGQDYILHSRAVAAQLTGEDEKIVALLHDILEDTFVTEQTLRNLFGNRIGDAVAAMTRRPEEPYEDYIRRLGANPLARAVKLADLRHNQDLSRLPRVTEADVQRAKKYRRAEAYLLSLG